MHLIELSRKQKSSTALYHELDQEDELSFEDYGGDDALEISEVVDAFAADRKILIHQVSKVEFSMNLMRILFFFFFLSRKQT